MYGSYSKRTTRQKQKPPDMYYYKFNIGDYKAHTSHLDPLEDITYRRMLDWQYLHERPLPLDIPSIGKAIGMRSHSDCIEYVLQEFYEETDEGYENSRVSAEIAKFHAKSGKARESARARWGDKEKKESDANALQTQCEGNANHKPITNNQDKHMPNSDESGVMFDQFWDAYPRKVGKKKAKIAWNNLTKAQKEKAMADIATRFTGVEPQFIKHPTTYIHGEHWEDEKAQVLPMGAKPAGDGTYWLGGSLYNAQTGRRIPRVSI